MTKSNRINEKERRASPRIAASEVIPHAVTRLASGQEVELVNISLNGAILINSRIMLAPGSSVRLKMKIPGSSMKLEGRIQRCKVIGLKEAKIQYEAAIILDGGFPQPLAEKLNQLDQENSPIDQPAPQEINLDTLALPETAELWVLNSQEA
jgi:hypothetical protein